MHAPEKTGSGQEWGSCGLIKQGALNLDISGYVEASLCLKSIMLDACVHVFACMSVWCR